MNNNNSILLIDLSFDPVSANSCVLLINVGLDSFSYAILDEQNDRVIAVFNQQECEQGSKTFAQRIKTDTYLSLDYRKVKIAAYTPNTISIPNELYTEESLPINAQYFAEPHSNNLYRHEETSQGFTTIFAFPADLEESLNFAESEKYPENAGLICLSTEDVDDSLALDFTVNSCSVLYFSKGKLSFQQCFQTDNLEEFNYYLLLVVNQLGIKTDIKVHLSGIVQESDQKHSCLKKYFTDMQFLTYSTDLNQEVLDDMPMHYFTSLLALNECE